MQRLIAVGLENMEVYDGEATSVPSNRKDLLARIDQSKARTPAEDDVTPAEHASLPVPTKQSTGEASVPLSGGKKRRTHRKPTPVAWMSKENGEIEPLYAEADVINMMGNHADDGTEDSDSDCGPAEAESTAIAKAATPQVQRAAEAVVGHIRFGRKLDLLKDYKDEFGTVNVSSKNCIDGKFKGLDAYVQLWRAKAKKFEEDPPGKKSYNDEAKILVLLGLGLDLGTRQTRDTPTKSATAAAKAAAPPRQRAAEAVKDSSVSQPLSTPVVSHVRFRRKLDLLKDYKDEFGTVNASAKNCTDGKFKGLDSFVQLWRAKAKKFEKDPSAKKSYNDEAKILVLLGLGLDLGTRQTRDTPTKSATVAAKAAAPPRQRAAASDSSVSQPLSTPVVSDVRFRRKVDLLKDYKDEFGTVNVSTKNCIDGKFRGLDSYVRLWRAKAKKFEKDPSAKKPPNDEAKVLVLLALGLDLGTRQTRPNH
jgi:hypothetical protein